VESTPFRKSLNHVCEARCGLPRTINLYERTHDDGDIRAAPPGARILTFSYSSSVLAVLRGPMRASACHGIVYRKPSHPGGQRSPRLARRYYGGTWRRCAIATFTEQADMALVGADSITVRGSSTNGDDQSGASMSSHGHSCYVVADRHKWFPAGAVAPASVNSSRR
jgi:translation initiation factor 2B subunit (eIF-2B alpha/beta/delta family)